MAFWSPPLTLLRSCIPGSAQCSVTRKLFRTFRPIWKWGYKVYRVNRLFWYGMFYRPNFNMRRSHAATGDHFRYGNSCSINLTKFQNGPWYSDIVYFHSIIVVRLQDTRACSLLRKRTWSLVITTPDVMIWYVINSSSFMLSIFS